MTLSTEIADRQSAKHVKLQFELNQIISIASNVVKPGESCEPVFGYSINKAQDVSVLILDQSQLPTGTIKVCIIGLDIKQRWQPRTQALEVSWANNYVRVEGGDGIRIDSGSQPHGSPDFENPDHVLTVPGAGPAGADPVATPNQVPVGDPAQNPEPVAPPEPKVHRVDNETTIEAEEYASAVQGNDSVNWQSLNDRAGFRGTGFVGTLGTGSIVDGSADGCRLQYQLDVDQSGSYYVWLRRQMSGTGSNSIYVQFGSETPDDFHESDTGTLNEWAWSRTGPYDVSQGNTTMTIIRREKGFYIDQIILTTDDGFSP